MRTILIVEDNYMIADMVEDTLLANGYEVCGIAGTVAQGLELYRQYSPGLIIVDLRLGNGELGTEMIAQIRPLGKVGILYVTGSSCELKLTPQDGHACLSKPYRSSDLLLALKIVIELAHTGKTKLPFPAGFHMLDQKRSAKQGRRMTGQGNQVRKLLLQQAAIASFGSFALRQSDLHTILTEAARACAEGLDVPFSKVCRYRAEQNDLLIEAGVGWKDGVVGHVTSRADSSSPQGRAFITGEPAICRDLHQDTEFVLPPFYAEHGIISTIDVLIKGSSDRPYGVLEVDSDTQRDYDRHDIDFLTGFANVLAEAVDTSERTVVLQATIERMKELVEEKDRLLDQRKVLAEELQHRVRNNLQLVYGMLGQQLSETIDHAGQRGIRAIARRVSTLSQVYDQLLGTKMTSTIDFGAYVEALCLNLGTVQAAGVDAVRLTCECEKVDLDLDVVTALGIVVAELVTNSFDHAFPQGKGMINVSVHLKADEPGMAVLTIGDDGCGFKPHAGSKRHGLGLVQRLVEQVHGRISSATSRGSLWTIHFPAPLAEKSWLDDAQVA